jgi:hypothetical protein
MIYKSKCIIDSLFATRSQWILWIMLMCCLAILALIESYNLYRDRIFSKEDIEEKFEPLTKRYGIRIVYQVNGDFLSNITYSLLPAGPSRHSKVTPIRHRVLLRYPQLLSIAFARYPEHVIKSYLNAIHFAGDINEGGFRYGGSFDPFKRVVYLIDDGRLTDDHAIYAFHHEFSSLLLGRHSLFLNPWFDQNPKGFVYAYDTEKDHLQIYIIKSLPVQNIFFCLDRFRMIFHHGFIGAVPCG